MHSKLNCLKSLLINTLQNKLISVFGDEPSFETPNIGKDLNFHKVDADRGLVRVISDRIVNKSSRQQLFSMSGIDFVFEHINKLVDIHRNLS